MSDSTEDPWRKYTRIDQEEFLDNLFQCASWNEKSAEISVYCIEPSYSVIETGEFIEHVANQYPQFVFSQSEIDEMREDGRWPFKEAQKRSDPPDDPRNDGRLGELILFLFVEAVLDIPMVSHKLFWTQEPVQEVKGSDGLFYGIHKGEESLALGESKIKKRRAGAIRKSLDSINRFHNPTGDSKVEHELTVAASNLSDDLTESEINKLRSIFTGREKPYQQIHPIFAAYNESWMLDVQQQADSEEDVYEEVETEIKQSGVKRYISKKLDEEEYENLNKYQLIFFLLPLEDADSFRESLQHEIHPFKDT